jgi:hypothetical protein
LEELESTTGKNKTVIKEVLWSIDESTTILISPEDDTLKMCKLPSDFKLVFFGNIGY